MKKMVRFHVDLGRIYWGVVRSAIERIRFEGYEIEHIESSGFIERRFDVKGDQQGIKLLENYLSSISNS